MYFKYDLIKAIKFWCIETNLLLRFSLVQFSAQYWSGSHWEFCMYSNTAKVGRADSKCMNILERFVSEARFTWTETGDSFAADCQ